MNQAKLQDNVSRAYGAAARKIGETCNAYRPAGPMAPLGVGNLYLRLPAVFAADPAFQRSNGYGRPVWVGLFDGAYTRTGDYLAGPSGTYFIASQLPLLSVLCVRTNRTVRLARPAAPQSAGVNGYGGVTRASTTMLLDGWPASLLATGGGGSGDLPNDAGLGGWTVLLPLLPIAPLTADLVSDDLGRTFVVTAAESTDLGWRLLTKQAST